jgi:hypothetical protein
MVQIPGDVKFFQDPEEMLPSLHSEFDFCGIQKFRGLEIKGPFSAFVVLLL